MEQPTPNHVVVAGGTGLVGGHLVPALLQAGHGVTLLTRAPGRTPLPAGARSASWEDLPGLLEGAGAVVNLYSDGGSLIGSATAGGATTTIPTNGSVDLADGLRSIMARQIESGKAESVASPALGVTIDTVAPDAPNAPAATAPIARPPAAAPKPLDLTILHTNDTWGYLLPCG